MPTSRHLWCRDLLDRLEVPGTLENGVAIIAQCQAEGGSAKFNPLNTTLPAKGSTAYNSVGVQNYTSYAQGLQATVSTLRQPNMAVLMRALSAGDSARSYWGALAKSPWGTHPPGMSIDDFLADIRTHWYARCMIPVAGT